jgi:hypothetical protein
MFLARKDRSSFYLRKKEKNTLLSQKHARNLTPEQIITFDKVPSWRERDGDLSMQQDQCGFFFLFLSSSYTAVKTVRR